MMSEQTFLSLVGIYSPKTNMTMAHPPFEDVFPIENGFFQPVMFVFRGVDGSTPHTNTWPMAKL